MNCSIPSGQTAEGRIAVEELGDGGHSRAEPIDNTTVDVFADAVAESSISCSASRSSTATSSACRFSSGFELSAFAVVGPPTPGD